MRGTVEYSSLVQRYLFSCVVLSIYIVQRSLFSCVDLISCAALFILLCVVTVSLMLRFLFSCVDFNLLCSDHFLGACNSVVQRSPFLCVACNLLCCAINSFVQRTLFSCVERWNTHLLCSAIYFRAWCYLFILCSDLYFRAWI